MALKHQNETAPTGWYCAMGRTGRVALITSIAFGFLWCLSLFVGLYVRFSSRSEFVFRTGGVLVKSYETAVRFPPERFAFIDPLGPAIWRFDAGKRMVLANPPLPEWNYILIPVWPAVLIPFVTFCIQFARRPRMKAGHCTQCGYNLTGNASGTCPECGTSAAHSSIRQEGAADHKN